MIGRRSKHESKELLRRMEDLAQRLQHSEPESEAFDEFSNYFGPRLKRRFLRLDPQMPEFEAEDLACELITNITSRIHQYQTGNFSGWVYQTAYNAFVDRKRRAGLQFKSLDEMAAEPADKREGENAQEEEDDTSRQEVWQAVRDAVDQLPDHFQPLIRCYFFENITNLAELDRRFGWPEGKARVYFSRAKQRLEKILSCDSRITGHPRIGKLLAEIKK